MEKLNITTETKRLLAESVKNKIKKTKNDYMELAIMYVPFCVLHTGYFHAVEMIEKENLEERGECYYRSFIYSKADGKLTLEDIEEKVFG